jgi:hypothetical protein
MEILIAIGAAAVAIGVIAVLLLRSKRKSEARQQQREHAPWTRSEKLSLLGIAVGAAIGIAGFVLSGGGDGSAPGSDRPQTNAVSLAALVRQGPFTEKLPEPLTPTGLMDVRIGDPSAASRVDAVELEAQYPRNALDSFFSTIEIYRSERAATNRAIAQIRRIKEGYGPEHVQGTAESYCAYLQPTPPGNAWQCGGSRGLAYAEVTVSPDANAYRHYATGTVSALLDYADEKARVAA